MYRFFEIFCVLGRGSRGLWNLGSFFFLYFLLVVSFGVLFGIMEAILSILREGREDDIRCGDGLFRVGV